MWRLRGRRSGRDWCDRVCFGLSRRGWMYDIGVGLSLIDYLQYVRYGIEYSSDM
jgi:hypothetical protein